MEKVKWSEEVTNEQGLRLRGEKVRLLNNILRRKANWIGHILRSSCLYEVTEVKIQNERSRKKKNTTP